MSNLQTRAVTGFFFALIIIGSILLGSEIQAIVFGIFLALGLFEFARLFKETDYKQSTLISVFAGMLLYTIFVVSKYFTLSSEVIFSSIFASFFLVFLIELWRKQILPLVSISVFVFGIIYLVVPFILMNKLVNNEIAGFSPLLGMVFLIWMNDTFAYLLGRKIGKTPLFERVSPKKTWEGTVAGIIMTIITSLVIAMLTSSNDTLFWFISGIIIAPSAIFGDLLESLFKRSMKIKDSGNILPGHGGILDRFDAVLFTVPFFYLWQLIYERIG
jgi:phosphatidate cytidylyltransferase